MDIGAYMQINDLKEIAIRSGIEIEVLRLRGLRLMKDEQPATRLDIEEMERDAAIDAVKELCSAYPAWNRNTRLHTYGRRTKKLYAYYLIKDADGQFSDIRWDRIHGKKRKTIKFEIKKLKRKIQRQYDLWNRYAGQEGVLYIHSRDGSTRWWGHKEMIAITSKPWFLGAVDDWCDNSYCDIYARVQ